MTVIIFLIVLAVLIFVHELGHFLIARLCGIRVDAFALGFGPKLISKKVGEVVYSLNLIPFGGYVKIFGENPNDESIAGPDKNRSFIHKTKMEQIAVLSSGVLFNFIFAWILIFFAFLSGVPASVSSYPQNIGDMKDKHIAIIYVNHGSPADRAGLKAGDVLLENSIEEIQKKIVLSQGKPIEIKYSRNKIESEVRVTAEIKATESKYTVGIIMDNIGILKLGLVDSFVESLRFTLHTIYETFAGLYELIKGIFIGESKLSSVTGPIGIAGLIGDAAKLGFTYLIMFTAIISINLGVLNLVPFPALDGGRILFVIIESIIRKPIKPIVANTINTIGFGLLMILIIVVTYKDIVKIFVE